MTKPPEVDLSYLFREPLPEYLPKPRPLGDFAQDVRAVAIGLEVQDLFHEAQALGGGFMHGPSRTPSRLFGGVSLSQGLPLKDFTNHVRWDKPIERHEFAPVLAFRRPM